MTVIISERSCFSIKLIWMQLSIISSQTWAHYFEYAKMNITFFLRRCYIVWPWVGCKAFV